MPKYYLTKFEPNFILITCRREELVTRPLLALMLSKELFSVTRENDGTMSILLTTEEYTKHFEGIEEVFGTEEYHCVQITTENPALQEAGMLSEITTFLAEHKVPILCLSTYNGNYIYYPADCSKRVTSAVVEKPDKYIMD